MLLKFKLILIYTRTAEARPKPHISRWRPFLLKLSFYLSHSLSVNLLAAVAILVLVNVFTALGKLPIVSYQEKEKHVPFSNVPPVTPPLSRSDFFIICRAPMHSNFRENSSSWKWVFLTVKKQVDLKINQGRYSVKTFLCNVWYTAGGRWILFYLSLSEVPAYMSPVL